MRLTALEVKSLITRLMSLPLDSPEAQYSSIHLQWRIDQDDLQFVVSQIDSPSVPNSSKEALIHLVGDLANPAVAGAVWRMVISQDFTDNEPLFHAAVKAAVAFGAPEDLSAVFKRLEQAPSKPAFDVLLTLLVDHRNHASESYLHSLIDAPDTNEGVRSTAVYMLAHHLTDKSESLLKRLINENPKLKDAASEALAKQASNRL